MFLQSLTSLPPDAALDLGSWFGFHATSYQSIPVSQFEDKELEVRYRVTTNNNLTEYNKKITKMYAE